MAQFNPQVQIRAVHVAHSILQVDVPAYELTEPLQVGVGLQLHWQPAKVPEHEKTIVTLQIRGHFADNTTAFLAEATMHQIAHVTGVPEAELTHIREELLPSILLPYLGAHLASLLKDAGYQHISVPLDLNSHKLRAEHLPVEPLADENVTAVAAVEELQL